MTTADNPTANIAPDQTIMDTDTPAPAARTAKPVVAEKEIKPVSERLRMLGVVLGLLVISSYNFV